MKRIALFLIIMLFAMAGLVAQTGDLDDLTAGFDGFAEQIASSAPLAASIGLNWNDATLKGFPHMGVGITTGAVFMPSEAFNAAASYIPQVSNITDTVSLGVPLPVFCIDARLGLPIIPADVGAKFGMIPQEVKDMNPLGDVGFDYTMMGADFRWALMKGNVALPEISVGVGYTRLNGNITFDNIPDYSYDLTGAGIPGATSLDIVSSPLSFGWESNVFDVKAQVSKKILILNLSAGVGYSYGLSTAGGGITSDVFVNGDQPLTPEQIAALSVANLDVDAAGVEFLSEANGGTLRLFGGVGVQLAILKLDLGAVYGVDSKTLGLSSNIRVQF